MINIDWIEIPKGEFILGLSERQKESIREKLRKEYGIDTMPKDQQQFIASLAEKYRRTVHDKNFSVPDDLTPEEKKRDPQMGEPLFNYLLAEAEIERIPSQRILLVPTFYIARFPLTFEQCNVFFESEYAKRCGLEKLRQRGREKYLASMPESVSWKVANSIAYWLGGRLPTLVEWEKAARGTDGRLYPWGDEWDAKRGNFGEITQVSSQYKQESIWRTAVDAFPQGASPYQVLDMLGNLGEWTSNRGTLNIKLNREYPYIKGISVDSMSDPTWFWNILARQSPGNGHICCRPMLSNWQRQYWLGVNVPPDE